MPFETGTIEATRRVLPEPAIEAFVPITHLGDPLFFVVLVAVVYWLGDHERGTVLVGATLLGLGLTTGLKELFALPRPPIEVALVIEEGYGLPSGHAAGSIVVYGTVAALYDVGPRRARYAAAALLAGLVSLSRVVLGAHYPGDVLAGVVLGCVVLLTVLHYRDRSPAAFFAVATGGALVGAILSRLTYESSLLLLGGALGALACWPLAKTPTDVPRPVTAACGAVALPVVVGLVYVGMAVLTAPLALVAATAIAMALVLLTPHAADRVATLTGTARTDTLY